MAWSTLTLATDADLTNWERNMPELGQKVKGPSGASAYDGKRTLAKNFIAKFLLKKSIDIDALADPTQLRDLATFKELELIYRDLSEKEGSIAHVKAEYYARLFEEEAELIVLTLAGGRQVTPSITMIPCYRA